MKKIITIFTSLLFMSGVSFAQTINMGMDTPDGPVNMGVNVKETEDGGVIMDMQMATPGGNVNMGTSANPNGVQQNMNMQTKTQVRANTQC